MQNTPPYANRNVHYLLGLPFDALTLDQAVARIRWAAKTNTPCFFSTPNLNFLITAQSNAAFRQSVIDSDLSLADGMPIVWLAKLVGLHLPERVAGSDVFEALRRPHDGQKIKVFFFGGPPGVAQMAAQNINGENGGLVCVGYETPGFGDLEELSTSDTLDKINNSGAEFLVVALGAVKGQAWILHNRSRLRVPVISHLGAVVNFVAGNVQRAPVWMQKSGLEWLWTIKEEPGLWSRYFTDAVALCKLVPSMLVLMVKNRC